MGNAPPCLGPVGAPAPPPRGGACAAARAAGDARASPPPRRAPPYVLDPSPARQATRLLAAVIAKNAVGSSWRKTLGTREWSRVPGEEKVTVREAVLRLLLADPSERCAAAPWAPLQGVGRRSRRCRLPPM
jgi:hypothetical protein